MLIPLLDFGNMLLIMKSKLEIEILIWLNKHSFKYEGMGFFFCEKSTKEYKSIKKAQRDSIKFTFVNTVYQKYGRI